MSIGIGLALRVGNVAAAAVDIVLSEASGIYVEAANIIRDDLAPRATVRHIAVEQFGQAPVADDTVVVALGTRALRAALTKERNGPVVFGLVPRAAYDNAVASLPRPASPRAISGVFLDQPHARQLNLVRTAIEGKSRIGVLTSAETERSVAQLQTAAKALRLTLTREMVSSRDDIYPALTRLLPEVDALLALPDVTVYSAGTIQNILMTTYRAQRPVFAFSPAYVRAGALAAVYSTPAQIAPQIAELVTKALAGNVSPPQYPRRFSVSVNAQVARSLGLTLEDEATLAARLERLEREQ
jgi:putative tryptophan/tyrosine transport system substrate-binding protein